MKATDNTTPDVGRTIGNGVVLAYGAAAVALTAMVLGGFMPWAWATGLIALMFAFVMGDDYVIQTRDMEHVGEYQTARERRDGAAEASEQ